MDLKSIILSEKNPDTKGFPIIIYSTIKGKHQGFSGLSGQKSYQWLPGFGGWGREMTTKIVLEEPFGIMEIFCILIIVVVTQLLHKEIHLNVYF